MKFLTFHIGTWILMLAFSLPPCALRADVASPIDDEMEALIAKLPEVSQVGYGYSATFSGNQFLPDKNSAEIGVLILGGQQPEDSPVLEQIVRRGARAVPSLLKHLGDAQGTKIPAVTLKGVIMWWAFNDEYDYNRRLRKNAPVGVNRDDSGKEGPDSHVMTVGDLCYVALGQIVNRNFKATRYQPTGGVIISSPSYSKALRSVVEADYKDFTTDKHRELLTQDFLKPDFAERRNGALRRIAFYYPEFLEPLVVKQLAVPTFDVFKTEDFVRNTLYREKSPRRRKSLFNEFLRSNGKAFSDGVLLQLFDDLHMQDADEQGRLYPPLEQKYDARALLIQLYGYSQKVSREDRPYINSWSEGELARFIESLGRAGGAEVDAKIYEIFSKITDNDYLAIQCMERLAGSSHDEEFIVYCKRRIPLSGYEDKNLANVLVKIESTKGTSRRGAEADANSQQGGSTTKAEAERAFQMVRSANVVINLASSHTWSFEQPLWGGWAEGKLGAGIAKFTDKREMAVVILSRPTQTRSDETLRKEADDIEQTIKGLEFKRVVFLLATKSGVSIYRE